MSRNLDVVSPLSLLVLGQKVVYFRVYSEKRSKCVSVDFPFRKREICLRYEQTLQSFSLWNLKLGEVLWRKRLNDLWKHKTTKDILWNKPSLLIVLCMSIHSTLQHFGERPLLCLPSSSDTCRRCLQFILQYINCTNCFFLVQNIEKAFTETFFFIVEKFLVFLGKLLGRGWEDNKWKRVSARLLEAAQNVWYLPVALHKYRRC